MQQILRKWGTPITLVLLLALLAFGAWWGWRALTRPIAPAKPTPCVSQSVSVLKSGSLSVRVYNGGGKAGLAGSTAAFLRSKGFKAPTADNTNEKITTTVIVGPKADDPKVKLLQGFFPNSSVREENRADGTLDVLIGSEFGEIKKDAPTQIDVPTGVVCIQPMPSSTTK